MPFIGPIKVRECRLPRSGDTLGGECRIPRSGDTLGGECRMPFVGPLKGACPSLCPQKAWRHSFKSLKLFKLVS